MKRNYQGVLKRLKEVADAHPQVNSVDDGRELEFDTTKDNIWPRVFIRTDRGTVVGGPGTAQAYIIFSMLCMDRMKADRSNMTDVMNLTHSVLMDILATCNKEQLIYFEDGLVLEPLYDYHDTQSSGWTVELLVPITEGFQCYPVP